MTTIYMCPHCGRKYSVRACSRGVPEHKYEDEMCPGSGQMPRNALTDNRPLWKDESND